VTTARKLVHPRKRTLDPRLKSWIDRVIVPTLVREYLASEKKSGKMLGGDAPIIQSSDLKASLEGSQ
jgi:hypothetical protein